MQEQYLKTLGLIVLVFSLCLGWAQQAQQTIKLPPPNKTGGLPLMEALSIRASVREWSEKDLGLQDLSDLLWAANGINRPDSGKRTASSAQNAQDVDIYVFMKDGVYLYDATVHALNLVASGDHRGEIGMILPGAAPSGAKPAGTPPPQAGRAPINLVLISDSARFRAGSAELRHEWGAIDAGIVSQNISIFCAARGLATRPRASVNREALKELLKLKETQYAFLEHPVGYPVGGAAGK